MNGSRLSWIALLLAAATLIGFHLHWARTLPERVAVHFDTAGRPNRWESRSALGFGTVTTHLGTASFLILLTAFMHRLPPRFVNLPNADYWRQPQHYRQACRFMRQWARWLAAATLVWATLLGRQLCLANQTDPPRLDSTAVGILTAGFLAIVALAIIAMFVRFACPPQGDAQPE